MRGAIDRQCLANSWETMDRHAADQVHESILELKVTVHTWPSSKPAVLEFLQVVAAVIFADHG
jgi:hypothetical protein